MRIKFWGVRGSVPAPATPSQIQAKISAAVQRITQKDLESPDARERFVSSLPGWIFGTAGGNTPCVELEGKSGEKILLDAGTGIRQYGLKGSKPEDRHYHIFLSHLHWDHIQGLPFFDEIYNKNAIFDIYSGFPETEKFLSGQQNVPYFPSSASFDSVKENMRFHTETPGVPFKAGNIDVDMCRMSHPGSSFSYSFRDDGKKFVFATDVELSREDCGVSPEKEAVFKDADAVVLDSQYTVEDSYKKASWGHSAFCSAVDFAVSWGIKSLYLFHHDPSYDDRKLDSILNSARWYAQYIVHSDIKVFLASEGFEFEL